MTVAFLFLGVAKVSDWGVHSNYGKQPHCELIGRSIKQLQESAVKLIEYMPINIASLVGHRKEKKIDFTKRIGHDLPSVGTLKEDSNVPRSHLRWDGHLHTTCQRDVKNLLCTGWTVLLAY